MKDKEYHANRVVALFSDRELSQIKEGAEKLGLRMGVYLRMASLKGDKVLKKALGESEGESY